jgi:ribonuclease P protein component
VTTEPKVLTASPAVPRVGFVVSKAVGNAVTRNRTQRVLRHLVAARLGSIPAEVDVVVRANPASAAATTPELAAELDRTLATVLRRVQEPRQPAERREPLRGRP